MRKTDKAESNNKITADIRTLAQMLDCGIATAKQIGENAGAVIHVGRRVFYNVQRIKEYMDSISE